ncbi:MAG TPA: NADH-quinone oxidoreductase subunit N, partial [Natronosporangium sp.]|nr:NADH-quinone oxidoreductase subunit N [Natronosporangium sp.]
SLLGGGATWLALVVAVNAVVGLAYYLRVVAVLYTPHPSPAAVRADGSSARTAAAAVPWAVGAALAAATLAGLVVGLAPQIVLDVASGTIFATGG